MNVMSATFFARTASYAPKKVAAPNCKAYAFPFRSVSGAATFAFHSVITARARAIDHGFTWLAFKNLAALLAMPLVFVFHRSGIAGMRTKLLILTNKRLKDVAALQTIASFFFACGLKSNAFNRTVFWFGAWLCGKSAPAVDTSASLSWCAQGGGVLCNASITAVSTGLVYLMMKLFAAIETGRCNGVRFLSAILGTEFLISLVSYWLIDGAALLTGAGLNSGFRHVPILLTGSLTLSQWGKVGRQETNPFKMGSYPIPSPA